MVVVAKYNTFDPVEHRRAKQAQRDKDAEDLAAGRVTAEELTRRNSMFAGFPPGSIRIKHDPYLERYKAKKKPPRSNPA